MPLMLPEFPQWQSFRLAWTRLIHPCPVLVVVSDDRLLFCWHSGQRWRFRSALLPDGACRDGVPLQRDAIGELIADLLFDLDLPGAQLVLCLPPSAASWRVIDGLGQEHLGSPGSCRERLRSAELPFDLDQSYLMMMPIQASSGIAAIARTSVHAWIDVMQIADLPLRRICWSLLDALRGLIQITQDWQGDLAWLLVHQGSARLLLIRNHVPDIDHTFVSTQFDSCLAEARACLDAWRGMVSVASPLAWWLTVDDGKDRDWLQILDVEAGEQCLNRSLQWNPEAWSDDAEPEVLPSLAHLALSVLHEEESW